MTDDELIARAEGQMSCWPKDRKTVDVPLWLTRPDYDRLIALARKGAASPATPVGDEMVHMPDWRKLTDDQRLNFCETIERMPYNLPWPKQYERFRAAITASGET